MSSPEKIITAPPPPDIPSYRELPYSKDKWGQVWEKNSMLDPSTLAEIFPPYNNFSATEIPLIWSKANPAPISDIIGLHAPTAAGKDKILDTIQTPLVRIITTTSRPQRPEDGCDGERYYFLTETQFQKAIADNEFLEKMKEVSGYYGTTQKEVEEKMMNPKIKLWRGNIQGHPAFAAKISEYYNIAVPGIFLLPRLTIREYKAHIKNVRGEEEANKRWPTALAEIEHAPEIVDYLIINPFGVPNGIEEAAEALDTLLSS